MSDEKKKKRGGARAGAGRPATGRQTVFKTTAISGSPEEIEALKKLAGDAGKSLSRFVIESILGDSLAKAE